MNPTQRLTEKYDMAVEQIAKQTLDDLAQRTQWLLQELKKEGFGGKLLHLCTGMGSSCLWSTYQVKDADESWIIEDAQGVLDYLDPGTKMNSELVCTEAVEDDLREIQQILDFVVEENLTCLFPHKIYPERIE